MDIYNKFLYRLARKVLTEASYLTGRYFLSPEFLSLIITFRCNFKCRVCSIWNKTNYYELSDDTWLELIDCLRGVFNKNTFIEINGGEPFIRESLIFSMIRSLKEYFDTVALNTNGSLIDEKIIGKLEKSNLDILKISFYSLNRNTHSFLRGTLQGYDNVLNNLWLLSKSNIKSELGVLITSRNIKELPDLIKYLNNFGTISITLQPLDEEIESEESKNKGINNLLLDIWPTKDEVLEFFSWVIDNRKNINNSLAHIKMIKRYYLEPYRILNYRCFAGQRNFVVYPDGEVAYCFKRESIGNLRERNINQILKNTIDSRKSIKNCRKYCRILGCFYTKGLWELIRDRFK